MRISDRSSDVCSSDLLLPRPANRLHHGPDRARSIGLSLRRPARPWAGPCRDDRQLKCEGAGVAAARQAAFATAHKLVAARQRDLGVLERSEEHTSELQSLMRISYAVFCLKKQKTILLYTTGK